jgi:hypothetical protein
MKQYFEVKIHEFAVYYSRNNHVICDNMMIRQSDERFDY